MEGIGNRLLTAIVALPVLISLIGWSPWWCFGLFATGAIAVALWEYLAMVIDYESTQLKGIVGFWCLFVMVSLCVVWSPPLDNKFLGFPSHSLSVFPISVMFLGVCLSFLILRGRDLQARDVDPERCSSALGLSIMGCVYLGVCGAHIVLLGRLPDTFSDPLPLYAGWTFLLMASTFLSDTGGYFVGIACGGPKIFSAVSPNKTWTGLIGCILGASIGSFGVSQIVLPRLTSLDCLFVGCGIALMGQIGDFVESFLKRSFGVKDSGSILPGHGGILDRIDALLFNGPFLYYYAVWIVLPR